MYYTIIYEYIKLTDKMNDLVLYVDFGPRNIFHELRRKHAFFGDRSSFRRPSTKYYNKS